MMTTDPEWCAPDACALPLADQPDRMEEWDKLFGLAVRQVERAGDLVRLILDREPGYAARVADLADRESRCCSFLTFGLEVTETSLVLTVGADATHTDVVDGLAARAARMATCSPPSSSSPR